MKPVEKIRVLHGALRPKVLTVVVDVGANPFAGTPPYGTFRRSDCSQIIGFEPLKEALVALKNNARHNDTFLPYAVGSGGNRQLYLTRNSGLVSTLKPKPEISDLLGSWWKRAIEVKETLNIKTKKLDEIDEVSRIDFLKIDIQGGELEVFRHGRQKLKNCAAIQTEMCLYPYYKDQPSFGDIQAEMTVQGFIAHKFVELSAHPISNNLKVGRDNVLKGTQLTVADMVFIKDPTSFGDGDTELIKHLAMLSFAVFRSFDLTLRCLSELQQRNAISAEDIKTVIALLKL